jgi:uncharacterized protein
MKLERQLTTDQLEALAVGASFLGTGGGGDPYIGSLMARQALEAHGPVTVIDPEDLPDDALCVMSAVMGAPTVLVEKLPGGNEQERPFMPWNNALDEPSRTSSAPRWADSTR